PTAGYNLYAYTTLFRSRERLDGAAVQDAQAAPADAGQNGEDPVGAGRENRDRDRRWGDGRSRRQWASEGALGHREAGGRGPGGRGDAAGPGSRRGQRRDGEGARAGDQGDGGGHGRHGATAGVDGVGTVRVAEI